MLLGSLLKGCWLILWTDAAYCVSQNFYNRYIDYDGTRYAYYASTQSLLDLPDKLQIVSNQINCNLVQRNSAIAERHFRTKLKRNLTPAIEISQHNANTAFFSILDTKRVNNLPKKADIYQYYDQNRTKLN